MTSTFDSEASDQIYDRLLDAKRTFTIESRGHEVDDKWIAPHDFIFQLGRKGQFAVDTAWQTETPLKTPLTVKLGISSAQACYFCGARTYDFDGFTFVAQQPCPHPDGLTLSVSLAVPSGRLYVGNDFREHFPVDEKYSVNTAYGIKSTISDYADGQMLHFFVGNTSPSLNQVAPDSFDVTSGYWYDLADNEHQAPGKTVATVCTDLWWVSIVDGDEADARGMKLSSFDSEVRVTPGMYTLDYHVLNKGFDTHGDHTGPTVYANLNRRSLC